MSATIQPVVRTLESTPAISVEHARGTTMQVVLGPDDGTPNFVTRRFTIDPGGRIPRHRHATIEHEQVVLEGEMVLGLDDETVTVGAGEAVLIPAGVAHFYENRGDVPVRFLCVVPRVDEWETEWLEPIG